MGIGMGAKRLDELVKEVERTTNCRELDAEMRISRDILKCSEV